MTRGKGKVNPITGLDRSLTLGERQDIMTQKTEAEATLRYATENQYAPGAAGTINKEKLKSDINRYDAILSEGAPAKLSGLKRDALIREAKELEEKLKENMPTTEEMNHPAKNPGAVQKHIKWEGRNLQNIKRYKEIMRQLEPDDPTNTSLDKLRREK
jgi:hypothetical protein